MMKNQYFIGYLLLCPSLLCAQKAAEVDSAKIWSGMYAGGTLGGIFNRATIDAHHLSLSNLNETCTNSLNFRSLLLGAQVGGSHQFESKLVFGVEGDFTYNTSQTGNTQCDCAFDTSIYDGFQAKNKNQTGIRLRMGYAMDHNLLPYVAAGRSFANLGLEYTNEASDVYSKSQTLSDWVLGAGLEWAYSPSWSVRLEYDYNRYPTLNMPMTTIYGLDDDGGHARLNVTANNIRASVNYWF